MHILPCVFGNGTTWKEVSGRGISQMSRICSHRRAHHTPQRMLLSHCLPRRGPAPQHGHPPSLRRCVSAASEQARRSRGCDGGDEGTY